MDRSSRNSYKWAVSCLHGRFIVRFVNSRTISYPHAFDQISSICWVLIATSKSAILHGGSWRNSFVEAWRDCLGRVYKKKSSATHRFFTPLLEQQYDPTFLAWKQCLRRYHESLPTLQSIDLLFYEFSTVEIQCFYKSVGVFKISEM